MRIDEFVAIKAEFSAEEFTRRVLIEIAADDRTPADIFSLSDFGEVSLTEEAYIITKANVELSYSCSVGYDRYEQYYDSHSKSTQTRKVTDWKPFSGNANSAVGCIVCVGETDLSRAQKESGDIRQFLNLAKSENKAACYGEAIEVSSQTEKVIRQFCLSQCFDKVLLPGNWQKNKSYTGTVNITKQQIWKMPEYKLDYTYGGQSYRATAKAAGDCKVNSEKPSIKASLDKRELNKIFPLFACGVIIAVLGILFAFCYPSVNDTVGYIFIVIGIGMLIVFAFLYDKFKKKNISNNKDQKIQHLEKLLAEKHLKPLTASERNAITKKK